MPASAATSSTVWSLADQFDEFAGLEPPGWQRGNVEDDAVHRDAAGKGQPHAVQPGGGSGAPRPAVGIAERDRRGAKRPGGAETMAVADADTGFEVARLDDLGLQAHDLAHRIRRCPGVGFTP